MLKSLIPRLLKYVFLLAISTGYINCFTPPSKSFHSKRVPIQTQQKKEVFYPFDLYETRSNIIDGEEEIGGFSYGNFAKQYPFVNSIVIAGIKTAAADLLAQVVFTKTPIDSLDWNRTLLFCAFGSVYLGAFQYLYQVLIFKRLFDVDKFTTQSWSDKLEDGPGLRALAVQTVLDLTVLTLVYLPTFYIFKAGMGSGTLDPSLLVHTGLDNYQTNFAKDELDLVRVWLPADIVCFSVPLYLRLPVRYVVGFVWTAYISFTHGGH